MVLGLKAEAQRIVVYMKALIATFGGIALMLLVVRANTNSPTIVVTTNWVTAAPNFRKVEGQLYNVELSSRFYKFEGECLRVTNSLVVIRLDNILGPVSNDSVGKLVCVRNYPTNAQPAIGQKLSGKAMRTGTIELGRATLELWDYGTPNGVGVLVTNYSR